ncbi:MAG TPA: FliH/SctL family protein [Methylibium sp.]|uniref:FliH/SctL family protein n=1 Tax=Methylibium sp. TaxID=2067992 RepID=UPI002DBF5CF5|nr:FliH/SctL family protein [Methylibium sp.]HEU4458612.1 FliH/SctL family protein [Methylibium sp.]
MTDSNDRRHAPPGAPAPAGTPRRRLHDPADDGFRGTSPFGAASPGAGAARFIPREELRGFAAWSPGSFGVPAAAAAPAPAPLTAEGVAAQLHAARQAGYQDGYRDGLVALEAFKQSYAQQITAQVATLMQGWQAKLDGLEGTLADRVAEVSITLARQVLRHELATRPELVAAVAQEALAGTLASARQLAVHVNPADHAILAAETRELLAERGARLVSDLAVARGGCVVETEVGVIDASVESRWRRATEAMGRPSELAAAEEAAP